MRELGFTIENINNAIVHALADLLDGDARYSAKSLEGTIGRFFYNAAGRITAVETEHGPEGYCYPFRADPDSLRRMCLAIFTPLEQDSTCRHSQLRLIQKMIELSESHMARFRAERDTGIYDRNAGYICDLTPDTDWGRWMIALKEVFGEEQASEEESQLAPA